jgi:DinB superfamily
MNGRIDNVTSELQKTAQEAREFFGLFSVDQLNWKLAEKSWSIGQCFDHLITTHSLYFPLFEQMEKGGIRPTVWEKYSPFSGFFGRFLIKSLDPANQKKMKTTSRGKPSASAVEAGIIDRYVEHQQKIIEALRKIPADIDPVTTIITSPLLSFVTYSLDDCYTVLVVHGQRHLGQAKRVTKTEGFPA